MEVTQHSKSDSFQNTPSSTRAMSVAFRYADRQRKIPSPLHNQSVRGTEYFCPFVSSYNTDLHVEETCFYSGAGDRLLYRPHLARCCTCVLITELSALAT